MDNRRLHVHLALISADRAGHLPRGGNNAFDHACASRKFVRDCAHADGERLVYCESHGPDVSCPFNLVKGKDYELRFGGDEGYGFIELLNPAGIVTISGWPGSDGDWGKE